MNILDEDISAIERERLRARRLHVRQIGIEVGRLERISIACTERYGLRRRVAAFTSATCRAHAQRSHACALQKIPSTRR